MTTELDASASTALPSGGTPPGWRWWPEVPCGARDSPRRALAWQNPDLLATALGQAIAKLGERFSAVTGEEPTRRKGQTHAGRGLVYSDCRRDVEFVLGFPAEMASRSMVPARRATAHRARPAAP